MKFLVYCAVILLSLVNISSSYAGIVLAGTRVVFKPGAKEANLTVVGDATEDYLIQSWVSLDQNLTKLLPNTTRNPMAVVPALAKIPAGRQQLIRIIYEGSGLPEDRESLFWLNVQEIPPKPKAENALQIALRQRIKLFYRPASIPASSENAVQTTTWRVEQQSDKRILHVQNLSPFFISMFDFYDENKKTVSVDMPLLAPFETYTVDITAVPIATNNVLFFNRINDFGINESFSVELSASSLQPQKVNTK